MNNDIAVFLRVVHAQLPNFSPIVSRNVDYSTVPDLTAHLRVTWRLIQNDTDFVRFVAGQNGFNNRFSLQKIVSEKFCRCEFPSLDTDFLLFLSLAGTVALPLHQSLKSSNIDDEPALARHQFRQVKGKTVC